MPITEGSLNDTAIQIQVQLTRAGTPVSLAGLATSAVVFYFYVGATLIAQAAADLIDDASAGKCSVTPPAAVRGTARKYTIVIIVTFGDGTTQTFPSGVANRYQHTILPTPS